MRIRSGFTLIELLIVVAIIAILAAIAVPNFLEAQTRAKVSRTKADLRTMATGLESYMVDNNAYPYTEDIGTSVWMPAGGFPRLFPSLRCGGLTSPIAYLTSIPPDAFKHDIDGIPEVAPLYYEKAGFGFKDATQLTNKAVKVPADAVGTNSTTGIGADTNVTSEKQTPMRYVLYGLGPDLSPHVVDRSTGTIVSKSRYNLNNRYDPTNGTVSTGNVIRFPGAESYP